MKMKMKMLYKTNHRTRVYNIRFILCNLIQKLVKLSKSWYNYSATETSQVNHCVSTQIISFFIIVLIIFYSHAETTFNFYDRAKNSFPLHNTLSQVKGSVNQRTNYKAFIMFAMPVTVSEAEHRWKEAALHSVYSSN